ncbi:hypothetical protein HMPREF1554_00226 [Porphyromonas gingivalis F0569]|nr:hypothetical protein HMPREF1554_00226 [Porphyromonas gingivalis F0569]
MNWDDSFRYDPKWLKSSAFRNRCSVKFLAINKVFLTLRTEFHGHERRMTKTK